MADWGREDYHDWNNPNNYGYVPEVSEGLVDPYEAERFGGQQEYYNDTAARSAYERDMGQRARPRGRAGYDYDIEQYGDAPAGTTPTNQPPKAPQPPKNQPFVNPGNVDTDTRLARDLLIAHKVAPDISLRSSGEEPPELTQDWSVGFFGKQTFGKYRLTRGAKTGQRMKAKGWSLTMSEYDRILDANGAGLYEENEPIPTVPVVKGMILSKLGRLMTYEGFVGSTTKFRHGKLNKFTRGPGVIRERHERERNPVNNLIAQTLMRECLERYDIAIPTKYPSNED